MKLQLIYVGLALCFFSSCSAVSNTARLNSKAVKQSNENQINMQFSENENCCVEMKDCEGTWNIEKRTIYLSGLIVNNECLGTAEEISIGIVGVDLRNMKFPHVICAEYDESGFVTWYNEAEVQRERNLCSANNTCEYQGDVRKDKIKLTITGFENNRLKGNFEGRIFLKGIGKLKFVKTSEYKDITKGTFNVNLSKEQFKKRNNYLVDNR